jgi:hypothetical protein
MRRAAGVVLSAIFLALVPALSPSIAQASPAISAPAAYDLGAAAFHALFGETSDAGATQAAVLGDRSSESPLRDLAMAGAPARPAPEYVAAFGAAPTFAQERIARRATPGASDVAVFGGRVFEPSGARFVPVAFYAPAPSLSVDAPGRLESPDLQAPPAAPSDVTLPAASAPGHAISLGSSAYSQNHRAIATAFVPTAVVVPVSLHLGGLQFDGHVAGGETQQSDPAQQDASYQTGANFDVRAGARRVNVDVSSSYEHLMRDDTISYSPALPPATQWEIGGNAAPALPSYADMSRLALGAKLAVPVTQTMTLGLNYNAQRLLGQYGLPGISNLDAIDNSYGGNVTFAIPRWSSQISVSASQYHYQDNIAPANTFSDLRGNVNFTVKF